MIFLLAAWAVQADATATQIAAAATATLPANELLPAPHDMAANHRTVNRAMLALLAGTSTELDATTTAALEDIAYQCPLQGGNAVYRARAFLRMFGEYSFHKVDCEDLQAARQNAASADVAQIQQVSKQVYKVWSLSPNPANNHVRLDGSGGILPYMALLSLHGQELHSWRNVASGTTLELPKNLLDGIYLFRLQLPDGSTENLKLVITH